MSSECTKLVSVRRIESIAACHQLSHGRDTWLERNRLPFYLKRYHHFTGSRWNIVKCHPFPVKFRACFYSKLLTIDIHTYMFILFLQFPLFINIITALVMYGVDTFLTISGFLLSYSFFKKYTPSQGKLNLNIYYLHRYIRWLYFHFLIIKCKVKLKTLTNT